MMPVEPYRPPRWLAGGHRMTVFTWALPRRFPRLPEPEVRLFDVAPGARVTAKCHWTEPRAEHAALLLLHGLEGSADAHYMRGLADKALAERLSVVRLNQRDCGGRDDLSVLSYHSGLTADPIAVIRELVDRDRIGRIGVAGYSLGGNLALKLAGELGASGCPQLKAVAAVSPALDLDACVRAIERRTNWVYHRNFLVPLVRRVRRKAALYPRQFDTAGLRGVRTIREFDERYTARLHGFGSAARYYHEASALRVVGRIRVPTLIITAEDDPIVPAALCADPAVAGNPSIRVVLTAHGGHCGFYARRNGSTGRYWAERAVVDFVTGLTTPAAKTA
jgi:predicted alpha/beta-fold hydrolase